jgi:hypothetical protein
MINKEYFVIKDLVNGWKKLFLTEEKGGDLISFFEFIEKLKRKDNITELKIEKLMLKYKEATY